MDLLLTTPPLNVFEQMALDEVLVRAHPQGVILRFYNWTSGPAVTFGYAQFVREVRKGVAKDCGPLCRRPTGGGVVFHQDDLTFSLVFQSADNPREVYKKLHGAVHAALTLSGLTARVFNQKLPASAYAPSHQHEASACFVNPVENDLLQANGQKILGGAIRRFGTTVLYQGSLQVPGARKNPVYKHALTQAVRSFLDVNLHIKPVAQTELQAAILLAKTQYNTSAWTEKF